MANRVKLEFTKTLQLSDFTMAATVGTVTANFVDMATFQVPAKQIIFPGNGAINLGVDNRGEWKADWSTAVPASIPGVNRLVLRDANGVSSKFIREDISADVIAGVKVGKGGQTGNEKVLPAVQEDEFIVLQFKSTAAATATAADSTATLPVTIQAL